MYCPAGMLTFSNGVNRVEGLPAIEVEASAFGTVRMLRVPIGTVGGA